MSMMSSQSNLQPYVHSSPQKIRDFPCNTSTAKQQYSIPKANRFYNPLEPRYQTKSCYDIPDTKSLRGTGFGYGQRVDIVRKNNSPSPNQYLVNTSPTTQRSQAFSMGIGRNDVYQTEGRSLKNSPGPGAYETLKRNSPTVQSSIKYSMRQKLNAVEEKCNFPGPGSYQAIESINARGKYMIDKYKNSGASIFSPPSLNRFNDFSNMKNNPGPGHYNSNKDYSENGIYPNAKFKSVQAASFPMSQRPDITGSFSGSPKFQQPGPGAYQAPSDFGIYKKIQKSNGQ